MEYTPKGGVLIELAQLWGLVSRRVYNGGRSKLSMSLAIIHIYLSLGGWQVSHLHFAQWKPASKNFNPLSPEPPKTDIYVRFWGKPFCFLEKNCCVHPNFDPVRATCRSRYGDTGRLSVGPILSYRSFATYLGRKASYLGYRKKI